MATKMAVNIAQEALKNEQLRKTMYDMASYGLKHVSNKLNDTHLLQPPKNNPSNSQFIKRIDNNLEDNEFSRPHTFNNNNLEYNELSRPPTRIPKTHHNLENIDDNPELKKFLNTDSKIKKMNQKLSQVNEHINEESHYSVNGYGTHEYKFTDSSFNFTLNDDIPHSLLLIGNGNNLENGYTEPVVIPYNISKYKNTYKYTIDNNIQNDLLMYSNNCIIKNDKSNTFVNIGM